MFEKKMWKSVIELLKRRKNRKIRKINLEIL